MESINKFEKIEENEKSFSSSSSSSDEYIDELPIGINKIMVILLYYRGEID